MTSTPEPTTNHGDREVLADQYVVTDDMTLTVAIIMDSGNPIIIALDPHNAPITVDNFRMLVDQHFYDGLIFHRIIEGFMIQGGDPEGTGTGMGGAPQTIKGEFRANGVDNQLTHLRGVISMARTNDPDSASSQFFICHKDAPHLDGKYAAFGRVIHGIDEVDRIAALPTGANDFPETPPVMERVVFVDPVH